MTDNNIEAEIFFDSYLPTAFERALRYAGDDGFVASLPQLLRARVASDYANVIWNNWFKPNSEESVVRTSGGTNVVLIIHGGGIFGTPARFETLFRSDTNRYCETSFTGLFAGKITEQEVRMALEGRLPNGTEFPVYTYTEFQNDTQDLPRRYGVTLDFDLAKSSPVGYVDFDVLKEDPLMIVRAGGVEQTHAYLDKVRARHQTGVMGSWHPFNMIVDKDQGQTCVPDLAGNAGGKGSDADDFHLWGMDSDYGIGADGNTNSTSMINVARYVAVAPRDASVSVRHLSFG
tara:strand:- start:4371 stop:5237 length:867 start_codon:yes stop_codon:yes gene_type:complete